MNFEKEFFLSFYQGKDYSQKGIIVVSGNQNNLGTIT